MGYTPATVIEAPPRQQVPFGLFSVVSLAEAATERWRTGVTWEALTCDGVNLVVGDCDDSEGYPVEFGDGAGTARATAFVVYGTYKCGPVGSGLAFAQAQAEKVLIAREQQGVEARFWQQLQQADTPPAELPGGDPAETLGALEQYLAETYGSLGVIHASRNAATTLAGADLIEVRGGQLLTKLGTPVVAGSGYNGAQGAGTYTGPNGELYGDPGYSNSKGELVPGGTWAYDAAVEGTEFIAASPMPFGYRSEIFENSNRPGDLLDRRNNDMVGIALREYLLGFEPCGVAFAALTLGCC